MIRRTLLAIALLAASGAAHGLGHQTVACVECHSRLGRPGVSWDERDWKEYGICIGCHDGTTGAPDVIRDAPGMLASGLVSVEDGRSAGGLNDVGDAGGLGAGYRQHAGHTLGSTVPPPGMGRSVTGARLVCRSCHAIHPNGRFRNLGPDPYAQDPASAFFGRIFADRALPTYEVVPEGALLSAASADVLVVQGPGGAITYDASRVVFLSRPSGNAMNAFCATCHAAFHGDANTRLDDDYVRHPTTGVPIQGPIRERLAQSRQPLRVAYRADGTAEVTCLTCHRAHGTRNAFGLVHWDPESTANGEDGAGPRLESLCTTCHRFDR